MVKSDLPFVYESSPARIELSHLLELMQALSEYYAVNLESKRPLSKRTVPIGRIEAASLSIFLVFHR